MRKPVQLIGTTLGAAALVGASAAAASAHDGSDHGGYGGTDHHGFGRGYGAHDDHGYDGHDGYDHHWYGDPSSAGRSAEDRGSDSSSFGDHSFADHVDHHWWGSHAYAHRGDVTPPADQSGTDPSTSTDPDTGTAGTHHAWTFDQRKAAIVSSLHAADARLAAFEQRLTDASAASDSGGGSDPSAAALAYVMQARAHVESLLAQVESATTDEELDQILEQAHDSGTAAPAPAV